MPGTDQGSVCRSWVLVLIVLVIHVGKLRHRARVTWEGAELG